MKKLTGSQIRQIWLDFFKSKNHEVIPSASLVPVDDPTLLWINAGVAPLKKYFDGRMKPNNKRMTNAQKSIRTNDIDNVGKTARHHTFFEMLGNFSIGDYFRDEVIPWAAELLFDEKYFGFDRDLIYITYYPKDTETFNKWVSCGVKEDHLIPLEGNFWEIGEGPCGPDTEIFFDRGTKYDKDNIGIKLLKEDMENDRYIEIWNIVFSQYNSKNNLKREDYPELPSKNIDTGSGLERLACVMQEVETNYDSDLFKPMMDYLSELSQIDYAKALDKMPFRVIADHIRTVTFALADGAMISNEGRGYVLRRILRRAVRYGKKLGIKGAFLYKMVDVVANKYCDFYPYLLDKTTYIAKIIKQEEESFLKTLENGEHKLQEIITSSKTNSISGKDAFLLYDTFGFPFELTLEIAEEAKMTVDETSFHQELLNQKERARASRNKVQSMASQNEDYLNFNTPSKFVGYDTLQANARIIGLFKDGKKVKTATGEVDIVLDQTPFYATMGGQIADKGYVVIDNTTVEVIDVNKMPNSQTIHSVNVDFEIKENEEVFAQVDEATRQLIKENHSATHLLNEALRIVLGSHVAQQGSLVTSEYLRFDFNHFENIEPSQLLKVEEIVNAEINKRSTSTIREMSIEDAKKTKAQMMFGEKYGSVVRVVEIGNSIELCGGTHVENTSEINKFAITQVESKGSGVYRITASVDSNIIPNIEAVVENTKNELVVNINKIKECNQTLAKINQMVKELQVPVLTGSYSDIINYRELFEESKQLVKQATKLVADYKKQQEINNLSDIYSQVQKGNEFAYLITTIEGIDVNSAKELVDNIANTIEKGLIFIAIRNTDRLNFICKVKNLEYNAGILVKEAAILTGGNGGGRPDFAVAGGKDLTKVEEALNLIKEKVVK